jgi:hypothetical protein
MFVGYFDRFLVLLEHLFEKRRQPLAVRSLKVGKDRDGDRGGDISLKS